MEPWLSRVLDFFEGWGFILVLLAGGWLWNRLKQMLRGFAGEREAEQQQPEIPVAHPAMLSTPPRTTPPDQGRDRVVATHRGREGAEGDLVAWLDARREVSHPASRPPLSVSATELIPRLHNRQALQQALVLAEVLGPPRMYRRGRQEGRGVTGQSQPVQAREAGE